MTHKGQIQTAVKDTVAHNQSHNDLFVLDSSIFSNVFKKDIKRVFIYKKSERLAKAIHLISPGFAHSPALRQRIEGLALALIDAAILPPAESRGVLSKELLALSSFLSVARSSGTLSHMNVDLISKEVHSLLSEIAEYEEPRFSMEETLSLAELLSESEKNQSKALGKQKSTRARSTAEDKKSREQNVPKTETHSKRQEEILSIIKDKKKVYIKDISTVLRDYSEKTIQRELSSLVLADVLEKRGDKRWTTYQLAG